MLENKVKCSYGNHSFVPHFYVIEDKEKKLTKDKKFTIKRSNNVAFDNAKERMKKLGKIHKIELYSIERIAYEYDKLIKMKPNEFENTNEWYKNNHAALYYNVKMMMGEFKMQFGKDAKLTNFDNFIERVSTEKTNESLDNFQKRMIKVPFRPIKKSQKIYKDKPFPVEFDLKCTTKESEFNEFMDRLNTVSNRLVTLKENDNQVSIRRQKTSMIVTSNRHKAKFSTVVNLERTKSLNLEQKGYNKTII